MTTGGDGGEAGVVTWRRTGGLAAAWDGQALARTDTNAPGCAPDRPATFALPAGAAGGTLVLTADGEEVLRRAFPLEIPADT